MNIKTAKYISYNGKNVTIKVIEENDNILWIPINTANTHYQEIQEWVLAGNTIEEAD